MSGIDLPKQLSFTGNGGTYPPHGIITADDHGPAVATMTWIMFNLMGLSVLARFATRRSLTGDNITIGVAAVRALMRSECPSSVY